MTVLNEKQVYVVLLSFSSVPYENNHCSCFKKIVNKLNDALPASLLCIPEVP